MSKADPKPVYIDIELPERFGGPVLACYCPHKGKYSVIFEGAKVMGRENLTLENVQAAQKLITEGKPGSAWAKLSM